MQEVQARRRGGVRERVERAESDAAPVEFVAQGDELAGAASETIDVEDDQDIVSAKIVKAGGQVGVLARGTGGVVLQHAP